MARLIGPDSGDRATVRPGGAGYARLAPVVVYAASSGTTLANILTEDGDAVADSTLTTDDFGLIPLFQFPDGVDTVYVEVDGGPRTAVYARYDDRVDGLAARVATLETTTQVLDGDLTTIAGLDSTTAGALVTDGAGWIRKTYAQFKTAMSFVKGDVGLGNVDNTSDVNKPISTATQTALDLKLSSSTAALTYVPIAGPSPTLRRDFTLQKPPSVLASPPATTAGIYTSAVAGSVWVLPFEPGCFTYLGGRAYASPTNPHPVGVSIGPYPYKTSSSPVAVEFWLDTADATGRFEFLWQGPSSMTGMRVAIKQADGSWGYVTSAATFSHTSALSDMVTLGAPGRYCIRLEFPANAVFSGLYVGPTDSVTATANPKRWIVVGDSFTEPTFDDSGSFVMWDGWVQQLSYMTGLDLWSAGSGGTGYVEPNAGAGRVKFRDRLAQDIFAFNPEGIIWAGGINDQPLSGASVAAEALLCFQAAKAAGVKQQIVLSPFWPRTLTTTSPANLVDISDRIKAAALSEGLPYVNLLELPDPTGRLSDWAGSTLQAARSAGGTTLSVASIPAYMQVAYVTKGGWYVKIGTGANTEIRKVSNITGSGPYTLTLSAAVTFAWAAGDPVVLSGPQYMTGTGKIGSLSGSGNSDRYTGAGGTHPTKAGHLHIARTVAGLMAQALVA